MSRVGASRNSFWGEGGTGPQISDVVMAELQWHQLFSGYCHEVEVGTREGSSRISRRAGASFLAFLMSLRVTEYPSIISFSA